ncbi:ferritin-like domain-containing protein [Acidihalobacter ferrooxydans]|uniref:ferroxidase n=1 Tax=Acidihalobacter ferrooxydans TaxID=1765967 RepID=A0A1P8UI38_9GAMM|nr:ferritin-like domain-containing protein [Acidihalobacter ferrooxydans]APZ43500.1 ferritin [Acidihalobacter ferrooxydans]
MNRRVDPRTLGWLNRALNHEMSAVQQYLAQSVLARLQGDEALATQLREECREELDHAARLMERLLLDGVAPQAGTLPPARVSRDKAQMLAADRQLELNAVALYESAAAHARRVRDPVCSQLFTELLAEEAAHVRELDEMSAAGTGQ